MSLPLIVISEQDAYDLYIRMNQVMFRSKDSQFHYRGYQKLHLNTYFRCPGMMDFPISMSDLGYTNTKLNNLKKFYFSDEELRKFEKQYKKGIDTDQASIFFSTVGADKGEHKKDHCIRGIGVNIIKGNIVGVHIHYRSSELTRKFLADLVFFNEYIWPELGVDKDIPIAFHFTCCYVHAKQFPMFAVLAAREGIESIRLDDPRIGPTIKKNINDILTSDKAGFGLVKTTNKVFREEYQCSESLKDLIRNLK